MNGLEAVAAVGARADVAPTSAASVSAGRVADEGFSALIGDALANVETRLTTANELVRAFALNDSVPIHQVTVALEEARLAVELALQVRNRLVEGYREIMNMQL